jgi:hypothetical protein
MSNTKLPEDDEDEFILNRLAHRAYRLRMTELLKLPHVIFGPELSSIVSKYLFYDLEELVGICGYFPRPNHTPRMEFAPPRRPLSHDRRKERLCDRRDWMYTHGLRPLLGACSISHRPFARVDSCLVCGHNLRRHPGVVWCPNHNLPQHQRVTMHDIAPDLTYNPPRRKSTSK